MVIRQIKKEMAFPPSHLYLEDVEELVEIMQTAAKPWVRGDEQLTTRFVVGDKRECDTIDDLKKLGGRWRNFEIHVGRARLDGNMYAFNLHTLGDDDEAFNRVLRITTTRETTLRTLLRRVPFWTLLLWAYTLIFIGYKWPSKPSILGVMALFVFTMIAAIWTYSAHTVVEFRYSHDPSPRMAIAKGWGSKAVWIVLGVLLTSAAQALWHYLTKR